MSGNIRVDRDAEAERIVAGFGHLITHDMKGWHVPSRSKPGKEYTVSHYGDSCNCPDHEYRGATCAHMRSVDKVIDKRKEWERAKRRYDSLRGAHTRDQALALADRLGV